MKTFTIKPFIYLLALGGFAALNLNSSGGAAQVQSEDRTGSPLSSATCALCHTDGAFNPSIELSVMDAGMNPVTEFNAGETYDIMVTISDDGASAWGFQLVALTSDDMGAGTLETSVANTAIRTLNGVMYAEHSARLSSNSFAIQWTAPEDVDSVTIYAAGNAVDATGNTSGDGVATTAISLGASAVASLREVVDLGIRQFPNPVVDVATFDMPGNQRFDIEIFDALGSRLIQTSTVNQRHVLQADQLAAGTYFWRVTDGVQFQTGRFIKL